MTLPKRQTTLRPSALALALVATLAVVPASAQSTASERPLRVWLALGPAVGGGQGIESGLGGVFQLTGQWKQHHAALRLAGLADFAGFPDSGSDNSVGEFGVTYGRSSTRSFGYTALAAGLSAVRVHDGPGFVDDSRVTVGIPLTAEAGLQSTFLGVALQAFANLNTEAPFAGVALNFHLGWMP